MSQVSEAVPRRSVWRLAGDYLFATDHKIIGLQFLFSSLIWLAVGGGLALAIRWQLAWPWSRLPILGDHLFKDLGGQISPEFYNTLFTMHATIMVFFAIIPILSGAFGNYLIPLMIGADSMALPKINRMSYWLMWPAFGCVILMLFLPGHGASTGWTAYPPLSVLSSGTATETAQRCWVVCLLFVSASSLLGAINTITTIMQMRTVGMTMFRLPMTVWSMLLTALMQLFALPVLGAALLMLLSDQVLQTGFFVPPGTMTTNSVQSTGSGQPLLWQHLFWFYAHPAVYVMILPTMGMVSDMIACFARKPLFGYRMMVYSMIAISSMGLMVWGHHMFVSGMNQILAASFMAATMLIALPSGMKIFSWIATLWGGRLHLDTPMLFSMGFVLMFVMGGLSGVVLAVPPVNILIHDTYYVVAHLHYVLFGASFLGVFGAIYFWFPKMFGRRMNEPLGKVHFLLTFVFFNGTFFPMHFLGRLPRRVADPGALVAETVPLNQWMTYCALALGAVQLIFVANFLGSLMVGRRCGENPWRANSLEWATASPPPRQNFADRPEVFQGPYEYSRPDQSDDFLPQNVPSAAGS